MGIRVLSLVRLGVESNWLARTLSWQWSAHSFGFGASVLGISGRGSIYFEGEAKNWRLVGSENMCGYIVFILSLFKTLSLVLILNSRRIGKAKQEDAKCEQKRGRSSFSMFPCYFYPILCFSF